MPTGKTACGACGQVARSWYDHKTRRVRDLPYGDTRIDRDLEIRLIHCTRCGKVKQEKLDCLAAHPFLHQTLRLFRRTAPPEHDGEDVADETRLNWKMIKALDEQYMQEQLRRADKPVPTVFRIDEISIRKGHTYRIMVSDLARRRSI